MRIFLTGGTGFIGGRVAALLRERGDEVVAMARSRSRATALEGLGCTIVEGDLADRIIIDRAIDGCDSVFHLAARFEVGVPKDQWPAMQDVNVGGTRRVMDSAIAAGTSRIIYASTIGVFGDTRGAVVDETFRRDPSDGFLSGYDESKYLAHMLVEQRAADGAPVVMVQPGVAYGPGDRFIGGEQILSAARGSLSYVAFGSLGVTMSYVDDVAAGIVAAHDRGVIGNSYVLGGEVTRFAEVLGRAADLAGRPRPNRTVPSGVLKVLAPLGPLVSRRLGLPPNLRELVRASDGVTYWASDAKARRELGYVTTELDAGLRATLSAANIPIAKGG